MSKFVEVYTSKLTVGKSHSKCTFTVCYAMFVAVCGLMERDYLSCIVSPLQAKLRCHSSFLVLLLIFQNSIIGFALKKQSRVQKGDGGVNGTIAFQ